MLFVIGLIGFIAGFMFGQMILRRILAGKSKQELMDNKGLHWKYGTLNWLIALLAMAAAMKIYEHWFLLS
jgi:ABC-type antimicrobial peptide transport system permease subunit